MSIQQISTGSITVQTVCDHIIKWRQRSQDMSHHWSKVFSTHSLNAHLRLYVVQKVWISVCFTMSARSCLDWRLDRNRWRQHCAPRTNFLPDENWSRDGRRFITQWRRQSVDSTVWSRFLLWLWRGSVVSGISCRWCSICNIVWWRADMFCHWLWCFTWMRGPRPLTVISSNW